MIVPSAQLLKDSVEVLTNSHAVAGIFWRRAGSFRQPHLIEIEAGRVACGLGSRVRQVAACVQALGDLAEDQCRQCHMPQERL